VFESRRKVAGEMTEELVTDADIEELIRVFNLPLWKTLTPNSLLFERLSNERLRILAFAYGMERQLERIAESLNTDLRLARAVENNLGRQRMKSDSVSNFLTSFGVRSGDKVLGNLHLVMPLFFSYDFQSSNSFFLSKEIRDEVVNIMSNEFGITEELLLSLKEKFLDENPLSEHQPIYKKIDELVLEKTGHLRLTGFAKMRFHLKSFFKELSEGLGWVFIAFALIGTSAVVQYLIRKS
jgi:hypothetical protein